MRNVLINVNSKRFLNVFLAVPIDSVVFRNSTTYITPSCDSYLPSLE
jgi:hypothetical protein